MKKQNNVQFIKSIKRNNNKNINKYNARNIVKRIESIEKDKIENIVTATSSITLYTIIMINYGIDVNIDTIAPLLSLGALDLYNIKDLHSCKKALNYIKENNYINKKIDETKTTIR